VTDPLPPDAGTVLTGLARRSIGRRLGLEGAAAGPNAPWLEADGAAFVTLTLGGELRGCIGSLEAYQPLGDDVAQNAQSAAFRDPRFPPLSAAEFGRVRIEVSVLSAPEPLAFTSEADALGQLRPGIDGVILVASGRRATFLPQVWEQLPEPATFVAHLKRKAGLPAGYWGDDVQVWRYGVTAFEEP
jgi:AmmeMemoRadiSam system protein A